MKKKKSKGFVIVSLGFLCTAVLGLCLWTISHRQTVDFKPDETTSNSETNSWVDSGVQSDNSSENTGVSSSENPSNSQQEYPKVTSEKENKVEIDFTNPSKPTQTPPPVPEGKTEIENSEQEHEVNPDPTVPEVTAPPAEKPNQSNPVPESSNVDGAVYDPVFGWIVPSQGEETIGDSDGDINKQVGNMG